MDVSELVVDIRIEISLEFCILALAEILKELKQRLEDIDAGFDLLEAESTVREKVATSKNHCEALQNFSLFV